jgi:outer membrane protein TolC
MVGIKIEFPLENRLARSQYARAKIQATQAVTSLKNAENLIINDVRDAIRRLETSLKVIDAAVASLKFSQEKLKAEEKKYKVGMSTAHDVLEFQEELARAESTLTYAQTEYSKSIANLSIAMGVLIEDKGLTL